MLKKPTTLLFLGCTLAGCGKEYSSFSVDKPIRQVWDEAVEAFARADLHIATTEIDSSVYFVEMLTSMDVMRSNDVDCKADSGLSEEGRVKVSFRLRELDSTTTEVGISVAGHHPNVDADCEAATHHWIREVVSASTTTAQESVDAVVLEPCREPCGLTLVPEREYGADSGEGMIEAEMAVGRLDASGRAYVIAGWSTPHVWVFGAAGGLLSRIGRLGSGPGEFGDIGSIVVTEDGVFSVLDRGRGVIMTFDWTGELLREVRTENWLPLGIETLPLEGSLVLHGADIRTPAQAGYPIHVVDLESGAIRESFGARTGEYEPGTRLRRLTIARGPGRSVWMAPVWGSYQVELWESNTLVRVLRRDVEWFPPDQMEGHGWEDKPDPVVAHIASDDSLLWVFASTADERWAEGGATRDWDLFQDSRIEVIDWRRGHVLATERFDEDYDGWVEPGLIGNLAVTPTGSVRYVTYRVQLEEGPQDGAGPG